MLPEAFLNRMKQMLGAEYDAFLASYAQERTYGLRINPLKRGQGVSPDALPFSLQPVPWTEEGFYYDPAEQPGKHILHEAGAYYIQEPSAMAVAEVLDPQPGERILDLCAAPGGKATHIAGKMAGQGFLLANEPMPDRAKILARNLERCGVKNAAVSCNKPETLAKTFEGFFDRILVDAPCSGEGMFRKDEEAVAQWKPDLPAFCAERQQAILEQAAMMLRAGGRLVYSTCTFAPEEDEGVVLGFLEKHPEFSAAERTVADLFASGGGMLRLWPHKIKGEGHFIACLQKADTPVSADEKRKRSGKIHLQSARKELPAVQEMLGISDAGMERLCAGAEPYIFGEQIFMVSDALTPFLQAHTQAELGLFRPGLEIGQIRNKRFIPAHALAMALLPEETDEGHRLPLAESEAAAYLMGETFSCAERLQGYCLLSYDGYSLGWGKAVQGRMQNHYPKGLRRDVMH